MSSSASELTVLCVKVTAPSVLCAKATADGHSDAQIEEREENSAQFKPESVRRRGRGVVRRSRSRVRASVTA